MILSKRLRALHKDLIDAVRMPCRKNEGCQCIECQYARYAGALAGERLNKWAEQEFSKTKVNP